MKQGSRATFYYGGQAVLEGVMMRGRRTMAVAVRAPSGQIVVKTEPLPKRLYQSPIARVPFLRGMLMLWDTLGLGMKALMFSADVALAEQDAQLSRPAQWTTVVLALAFAIGLFFVLPLVIVGAFDHLLESSTLSNLIEGVVRLGLLVGYVGLIGRVQEIGRVYAYHGAEHKTINAHERGVPLVPEEVARQSITHVRCGTNFLLLVVAISVLVFALFGRPDMVTRIASRVVLIPVIAAIAYEVIRLGAARYGNPLVRLIMQPGLALQRLTTREPSLDQIEVGIAAFKAVLAADEEREVAPRPAGVRDSA